MIILVIILISSCNGDSGKEIKDKELSSFMLGGIYFINGYGGIDNVTDMMSDRSSNKALVSGYKEVFEFAFDESQGAEVKSMFRSMWDISNKQDLLTSLEDLKTREYKYKAWDYARIINNASLGYAASYLTKDEVKAIIIKVLPLAQAKYKNWKEYFEDFDKGREDWYSEDPESEAFHKISKEITIYTNSIYKVLPLNTVD